MKNLLCITLILLVKVLTASTYYFSTLNGDDSRTSLQAQNKATPWQTISRLNSFFSQLKPGDSILFQSGEVFYGSLIVSKSGASGAPLIFSNYGTGDLPVISGLLPLTNWSSLGNGIWKSSCTACAPDINLLLINNEMKEVGRYPNKTAANKGYLNFESHTGITEIKDNQLLSTPNWTGGEVVIRKTRWVIDKNYISNHTGNSIKYISEEDDYEPKDNFGFFIQRHPLTMDQEGEWYFDKTDKSMQVYFGSLNPQTTSVKAGAIETLISIKYQSELIFENIGFTGSNSTAFEILDSKKISIKNCSFSGSGANGVTASGTEYLTVTGCTLENIYNNALRLGPDCSYTQVTKNTIRNTGMITGMGKSGDETYQAITVKGSDNLVEYNQIENTGYIPIRFDGNSTNIKNNFINNFDLVKDDGGGIYAYKDSDNMPASSNRKITGNIIINGKGCKEGTDNITDTPAFGIYMDDYSDNVDISGNTIAFCSIGLFVHNSNKITITSNTLYANNSTQVLLTHDNKASTSPLRNLMLKDNILFAKYPRESAMTIESIKDDISLVGTFDGNYYSRPLSDNFVISTMATKNNSTVDQVLNLERWQQVFGKDISSKDPDIKVPAYTINTMTGTNKISNNKFNTSISGVSCHSPSDNCSVIWLNNSKLDAGALAVSFANKQEGNTSEIIVTSGVISSGKNYLLKFSLLGSVKNRRAKVFLRNSASPYNAISEPKYVEVNNNRMEYETLLSTTSGVSNGCVIFEFEDANEAVWLDNIELSEADITVSHPDDYFRFEYNATGSAKTLVLNSLYKDIKGNPYGGSINLDPYTSVVLIKQSEMVLTMTGNSVFTATSAEPGVQLRWIPPAGSDINLFEIERSVNGADFLKIGKTGTKNSEINEFIDTQPILGQNYYRIKFINKQNEFSYSETKKIDFRAGQKDITISPNPARNILSVQTNLRAPGRKGSFIIQNIAGTTYRKMTADLSTGTFNIDVSSLPSGNYILNIVSDDVARRKIFVKL